MAGFSASAANSGGDVSSSAQSAPVTIYNHFENCDVNMQQGTHNVMETLPPAAPGESSESSETEMQSLESTASYDVVIQEAANRELDLQMRSEQHANSPSHCSDEEDDITYPKRVIDAADVSCTSPEMVCLHDEMDLPGPLQSSLTSQFGRSQCDVCSSSETEVDNVNSHRYAGGDEFRRVAGLHAEGAAEEDIMRKNLAADDGSIDNDDNDDNQGGLVSDEDQSSSVGLQDSATAGLAESPELDSAHAEEVSVQRMGGDSCNTRNFLNLSSTNETIFGRELQSDMVMLPTSPSVQQESSVNNDLISDQSSSNSPERRVPLDQHTADHWSWWSWLAICVLFLWRHCQ